MVFKAIFSRKGSFLKGVRIFFVISVLVFLSIVCSTKSQKLTFRKSNDGSILFSNRNISLKILPSTKLEVNYIKNKDVLSIVVPDEKSAFIPHYIIVNDQLVDNFIFDPESLKLETIESEFGNGKRLFIKAETKGPQNSVIEKVLEISLYDKYPDAALVHTTYKNLNSDNPILIQKVFSNAFQLDRKQLNNEKDSYNFWGFLGYGKIIGGRHNNVRVNVMPIEPDLDVLNDSEVISGVPMVDIWSPEMGMAIASIEKKARILKMPVKLDDHGYVNIGLLEEPEVELKPGESYNALKTAIIVHALDYYDPLRRWADLMVDQGMKFKSCPEFGYDPFWCNWGYKKDWSLSHGLDRLDEFKELGIKAVTIDDGWFDKYGDWFTSPDRFPKGDRQLKKWVDKLHSEGLKAVFWWVPGIGGPETIKAHPEWAILDKNGEMPSVHWKDSRMLCPTLPDVIQHHRDLTKKFIVEYGFDGFKMDGIYVAPRCYNPAHNHKSPDESYVAYEDVFKAIHETAMELKPDGNFILGMCPCGSLCSPYYLQWGNRPVAADPPQMAISTRHRVKIYKALLGSTSCVDNDFHERYNDYFPVEFGCGGLMTTKYTRLSDYEFKEFKKWYGFYNKYCLSSGEYLNLYDIGYDIPETYVIKKDGNYFYTFLKPGISGPWGVPWFEDLIDRRIEMLRSFDKELEKLPLLEGMVELRGLEDKKYTVFNLETEEKLGEVRGPVDKLNITFKDHLIVRVVPE